MVSYVNFNLSSFCFFMVILFHEFGHFIVAKASNIKVNEFSIGMGPKIFQIQKGETKYSIRILPVGGYCSMEGEDKKSDDPRSFNNAPIFLDCSYSCWLYNEFSFGFNCFIHCIL